MQSKSSSGFPTPESLALAQIEYHKVHAKNKKSNNGKNGNVEIPEPYPPPTTKNDIYNEANYKQVDLNARKVEFYCLFHIYT